MIISEIPKSYVLPAYARVEIIKISKEIHLTMIMLLCSVYVHIKSPRCIVYCGFNISIKCNFFKARKEGEKKSNVKQADEQVEESFVKTSNSQY